MRGFAAGVVVGLGLGAAGLAWLSLQAPVARVVGTDEAGEPVAAPSGAGTSEDEGLPEAVEAQPSADETPAAAESPDEGATVAAEVGAEQPAEPAPVPEVVTEAAPEVASSVPVAAEPGAVPEAPEIPADSQGEASLSMAPEAPVAPVPEGEPEAGPEPAVPAVAAEAEEVAPPEATEAPAEAPGIDLAPEVGEVAEATPPAAEAAPEPLRAPEVAEAEGAELDAPGTTEAAPEPPSPEEAPTPDQALAQAEPPAASEVAPVGDEPAAVPAEEPPAPVPTANEPVPTEPREGVAEPEENLDAATLESGAEAAAPDGEEVAAALPGRVQLEGSALPGRDAVRVNRPGAEAPAEEPAAAPEPVAPAEEAPALERYAADWEPPAEARPLLSVVLLDDGATDPAEVAALPWPVSVAVDPSRPEAAERLAAYRAAGVEGLVLAELPTGAQPVDAEVFLGAALDELPETVAVLDLGGGGLGGRDATAQMAMSVVARDGRGVVLGDRGFRSGLDLAAREGVPAAEVLRDLDDEGQDAAAIRRGLDDAVRRAGQEGEAVVLGRVGPGMLAALAEWSREGRAQEVTVAPVSGVLKDAASRE